MDKATRDKIIEAATHLLASHGYAGTGMRELAQRVGIKQSAIYHYFPDKQTLFQAVRQHIVDSLNAKVAALPSTTTAHDALSQRIRFQFEHIEEVVALLQYFMAAKASFRRTGSGGYVPEQAYQSIAEIIDRGIQEERYDVDDPLLTARIITHILNGFLLEYYPHPMTAVDIDQLTHDLTSFIERSLMVREVTVAGVRT